MSNKDKAKEATSNEVEALKVALHDITLSAIDVVFAQQTVDESGDSVSERLVRIAAQFDEVGTAPNGRGTFKATKENPEGTGFLGATWKEAQWACSPAAKEKEVEKLPRCWTETRSRIAAAMAAGIPLLKEDGTPKSVSSLRDEIKAHNEGSESSEGTEKVTDELPVDQFLSAYRKVYEQSGQPVREAMELYIKEGHQKFVKLLDAVLPVRPTDKRPQTLKDVELPARREVYREPSAAKSAQ